MNGFVKRSTATRKLHICQSKVKPGRIVLVALTSQDSWRPPSAVLWVKRVYRTLWTYKWNDWVAFVLCVSCLTVFHTLSMVHLLCLWRAFFTMCLSVIFFLCSIHPSFPVIIIFDRLTLWWISLDVFEGIQNSLRHNRETTKLNMLSGIWLLVTLTHGFYGS